MNLLVALALLANPLVAADTGASDLVLAPPAFTGAPELSPTPPDTIRRRPRAIEVSDWYERRLRLHKLGAVAMLPLFGVQAVAGNQIFQEGRSAPAWARTGHRVGATGLAFVFGANTVTGLWNLWDSRHAPGATRRSVHSLFMLASDAGFTYAGVRLADQAENDAGKRREHRNLAYASMASAAIGAGVMLVGRED